METNIKQEAIELFNNGYNCSQAVIAVFGPKLGLNKEFSLKVATGFGGGMAQQQSVCGAVTGAYMVIGLKFGNHKDNDSESKSNTYSYCLEFNKKFVEKNSSLICIDILGENMNTQEGMKNMKEKNLKKVKCEKAIIDAIEILDEMI